MKNTLLFILFLLAGACNAQKSEEAAVYATKEGAIKGYDPVAYFTQNQPVKGQAGITFDWNGATWHFTSAANRDLFAGNPEKYAPQYGGWCAYGWAQGYPAKTAPDAWSIVDGKLYLNYNKNVQNDWNSKQAEYIQKADKNYRNARQN